MQFLFIEKGVLNNACSGKSILLGSTASRECPGGPATNKVLLLWWSPGLLPEVVASMVAADTLWDVQ